VCNRFKESLMLESTRPRISVAEYWRNTFRSGILAPHHRLRKRWKWLTPMQISCRRAKSPRPVGDREFVLDKATFLWQTPIDNRWEHRVKLIRIPISFPAHSRC